MVERIRRCEMDAVYGRQVMGVSEVIHGDG